MARRDIMSTYEKYDYQHEATQAHERNIKLAGGLTAIAAAFMVTLTAAFHISSRPLPGAMENLDSGKVSLVGTGSGNNAVKQAIIETVADRFYDVAHASGIFWAIGPESMHEVRIFDAPGGRGTHRANIVVLTAVDPGASPYTQDLFDRAQEQNGDTSLLWVQDTGDVNIDRDVGLYTFTVTGTDIARTAYVSRDAGTNGSGTLYPVGGNSFALVETRPNNALTAADPEIASGTPHPGQP